MGAIVILVGLSIVLLLQEARRRELERRVADALWDRPSRMPAFSGKLRGLLHHIGEGARRAGLYTPEELEGFRDQIVAAGYSGKQLLPVMLGLKIGLMLFLPILAGIGGQLLFASARTRLILVGAALILGMRAPNWAVAILRRSHIAAVERGTPDALDLLVVCSEAGMGLESALERVARDTARSNPQVAVLLSGLVDDLRILPDRREALQNFARRSQADGMRRFATMLAQALPFGTPLAQALRAIAAELRRERAAKLEERAVKLATKLTFPVVLFMMPSIWIVLIGGSFLRLMDTLGSILGGPFPK
jgi:tight adherence protein C